MGAYLTPAPDLRAGGAVMALSRRAAFRSNLVCSAIRSVTASLALKISFALKARMVLAGNAGDEAACTAKVPSSISR
jgi:hypothetical protein